jgi:glycosyltransferase involved in cell wall biosynthesis
VIATVITPCSLEHRQYLPKVIQSVQGLKTPVRHLIGIDLHRRGAGYVRNGLLKHVTTPYVIFLDVDDEIHPEFLDHTLPHIAPQKYVYTAWSQQYSDVYPVDANNIWYNGTYHLITTLLNTSDVVRAGGFDVTLSALEDTEFYVKLITDYCVCPVYVPKPAGQKCRCKQGKIIKSNRLFYRGITKWHVVNLHHKSYLIWAKNKKGMCWLNRFGEAIATTQD